MSDSLQNLLRLEKVCRRCKIERRVFSYSAYFPERRCGKDRRRVKDPAFSGRRGAPGNIRQDGFQPATKARFNKPGAILTNMASLTTWTPDGRGREEDCPVLDDPEPDCYCLNLTSLNIPKAVQFCLRDFRQCPIYKNYMGQPEL